MAKAMTSDLVQLLDWRLSFANLDKAKPFSPGQAPTFQATFLGDPTNEAHAAQILALREAAKALVKAKWGEKPAGLKLCYGLADEHESKRKYDGYAGMFYLVTGSPQDRQPEVYNRKVERIGVSVDANGNVLYPPEYPISGYYVNTGVTLWTQDNSFGKAIRANLRRVQFFRKGTPFAGGPQVAPNEEFRAYKDEAAEKSDTKAGVKTVSAEDFDM